MADYETRIISVVVAPKDETNFSEMATIISIEDDAGGEYVTVSQVGRIDLGKIAINPEEWPTLRSAIDDMIVKCKDY